MKLLFFLSFVLIFVGCFKNDDENYNLPEKYKNMLKEGDTLIYSSSDSRNDTLVVIRKVFGYYRKALSGTSCKKPWAYFEVQSTYLDRVSEVGNLWCQPNHGIQYYGDCGTGFNCHSSLNFEIGMRDMSRKDNRDFSPTIYWKNRFIGNYSKITSDTIINELQYNNVLVYKPVGIDSLKKVIFSHKIGIVTIEYQKGYTIMFKGKSISNL